LIELSSTHQAAKHAIEFYIATPLDQLHATPKNGMMIATGAPTMQNLEQFHTAGLTNS
tara:strand:+ start:1270 stop:1443 length:174 start_codon:yes stop_codon:yes gene_type:complete